MTIEPGPEIPVEVDRFSRQRELVPADRLAAITTAVIGVGAIGRQAPVPAGG